MATEHDEIIADLTRRGLALQLLLALEPVQDGASMSTQGSPDLRALRLAYGRAIAAAQALFPSPPRVPFSNVAIGKAEQAEIAAGRAYMAALDEQDPACHVCGCTDRTPCISGSVACSWAHKPGEPPLCDFCTQLAGLP